MKINLVLKFGQIIFLYSSLAAEAHSMFTVQGFDFAIFLMRESMEEKEKFQFSSFV